MYENERKMCYEMYNRMHGYILSINHNNYDDNRKYGRETIKYVQNRSNKLFGIMNMKLYTGADDYPFDFVIFSVVILSCYNSILDILKSDEKFPVDSFVGGLNDMYQSYLDSVS